MTNIFTLRAGDGVRYAGQNCRVLRVTESAAGHATAIDAALIADVFGDLHDIVQFFATHFVVIAQRRMAGIHELPHGRPVGLADAFGGMLRKGIERTGK